MFYDTQKCGFINQPQLYNWSTVNSVAHVIALNSLDKLAVIMTFIVIIKSFLSFLLILLLSCLYVIAGICK